MDDEVADEEAVTAAVRALEAADEQLRSRDWPALADAHLRDLVGRRLRGLGRQLLPVMDESGSMVAGYLSTWSDGAGRDLASTPSGLQEEDLAILALIYLHWGILGRVLGETLRPVTEQLDAYEGSTGRDAIQGDSRRESLARLRARQLITTDDRLGPAFKRLTPAQRTWLDQNLVLLLRPGHTWAEEIHQSRQAERLGTEAP
jgi:hypothetical protein